MKSIQLEYPEEDADKAELVRNKQSKIINQKEFVTKIIQNKYPTNTKLALAIGKEEVTDQDKNLVEFIIRLKLFPQQAFVNNTDEEIKQQRIDGTFGEIDLN